MRKVFIDVTELAGWQGKLTGVPRVMSELSSRFAARTEFDFVIWDTPSSDYLPISFEELHLKCNPEAAQVGKSERTPVIAPSFLTTSVKKMSANSKLVSRILNAARNKIHSWQKTQIRSSSGTPGVEIKNGDILFVLCDWHGSDKAFVEKLTSLDRTGVSLVQICYDLLPIVTPQYSGHATESLTRYGTSVYPLCKMIIAISEHTKHDVAMWLSSNKLRVPPIEVMRLGDDFNVAKSIQPADKAIASKLSEPFILCVGTIEARKNHALLYYVYKLACRKSIVLPPLVVVGRRGWKSEDIYDIITLDPETKDDFIFLSNTTDEELSWLYANCLFSVYPSFYEGWGLPIAESIAHGVPCICSNTSSMPEVAGDLVRYFNPASTDECLEAINLLLNPKELRRAKAALKNYNPTSWDQTFDFVNKLIGGIHDRDD